MPPVQLPTSAAERPRSDDHSPNGHLSQTDAQSFHSTGSSGNITSMRQTMPQTQTPMNMEAQIPKPRDDLSIGEVESFHSTGSARHTNKTGHWVPQTMSTLPSDVVTDAVPTPSCEHIADPEPWVPQSQNQPIMRTENGAEDEDRIKPDKTGALGKSEFGLELSHADRRMELHTPGSDTTCSGSTDVSPQSSLTPADSETSLAPETDFTEQKRQQIGIRQLPPDGMPHASSQSPGATTSSSPSMTQNLVSEITQNIQATLNRAVSNNPSERSHGEQFESGEKSRAQLKEVNESLPYYEPFSSSDFSSSSSSSSTSIFITSASDYVEIMGLRVYFHEIPVIPDDEYPEELREEQYDIALIFSEDDTDDVVAFKEFLEEHICLQNGEKPRICLLDQSGNLTWIQSKIKHLEEAIKRSTHMFMWVTNAFWNDAWADMQKDAALMESVNNRDKMWSVVPVFTQPKTGGNPSKKYDVPFGFRHLNGIRVDRLSKGENFAKVIEENDFKELNKRDKYFLQNLKKMIEGKMSYRRRREEQQNKDREIWRKEEIRRRARDLAKERHAKRLREAQVGQGDAETEREVMEMAERVAAGQNIDGTRRKKKKVPTATLR